MRNILKNAKDALLVKKIIYVLLVTCLISVIGNLAMLFSQTSGPGRLALFVFMALLFGLYGVLRKFFFDLPRHFFNKAQVSRTAQDAINSAVGPAPWYWETFPEVRGSQKSRYVWKHHGNRGKHAYLVSLTPPNDVESLKIVINTYTRVFWVPPAYLGVWFVEKSDVRILCFDPDKMPSFAIEDLPQGFRKSKEAIYTLAVPVASLTIPRSLKEGRHELRFPGELDGVEELFLVVSYGGEQAAYAIFELHPATGEVIVMPQKWFTSKSFDLGYEWITRVARDPETGILYGDGIRIGIFELSPDGCQITRWVGVS